MTFSRKKFGFTVAEVMIAMMLLGLVATMTMKNIGTSIQHHTRTAEFKTAYSKLDLALKTVLAEHSAFGECYACPSNDDITKYGLNINGTCVAKTNCGTLEKYLMKELGVIRTCDNSTDSGCIPPRYKTGVGCFTDFSKGKSYILDNGMILLTDSSGDEESIDMSLTQFAVDINGKKGPNTWGQDIFTFAVTASDTSLDGDTTIVNNVTILPSSACTLGAGGSNGAKSSAQMLKEMVNYK